MASRTAMPSPLSPAVLHRAGVRAAVDQQILAGNIARARAAHKSAERAELIRVPEAPRRVLGLSALPLLLERGPGFLCLKPEIILKTVGGEGTRQQVVDRRSEERRVG